MDQDQSRLGYLYEQVQQIIKEFKRFSIIWNFLIFLYFFVGVGAFWVSYKIEAKIFIDIYKNENSWIAAAVFEFAKALTVIFQRAFWAARNEITVPRFIRFLTIFFQIFLFVLSIICTITLVASVVVRPGEKEQREKDKTEIEKTHIIKYATLENEKTSELNLLKEKHDVELKNYDELYEELKNNAYNQTKNYYIPIINELEAQQTKEMYITDSSGRFKGKRYDDFERRKKEAQAEYNKRLTELDQHFADRQKIHNQERRQIIERQGYDRDGLIKNYNQKRKNIDLEKRELLNDIESDRKYSEDRKVQNEMVVKALDVLNDGILRNFYDKAKVSYTSFTSLLSLLISILLEMTIYLTFNCFVITQSDRFRTMLQQQNIMLAAKKNF